MDEKLTQALRNLGVLKLLCLVSRRAAGVWSLLPSLAYQNLSHLSENENIVLVDFGKRNEMFEHLRIIPSTISPTASLAKLINNKELELIDYYRDIVLNLSGEKKVGDDYKKFVKELSLENKNLLLCPHQFFHLPSSTMDTENVGGLKSGLIAIAEKYHPKLIYLTFEGQPERPIFDHKLSEDKLMEYCLNACDIILSLVRTDSLTRFNEGIDIPAYLAFNQDWRSKVRLFLTRHPVDIGIPRELSDFVIGNSPFFDLIGQSIESGRIPWIDFKVSKYDDEKLRLIYKYFAGIEQASKYILDRKQ